MSLLNLPNPTETPEVRAYYEDVYRFGINNTFDELQFSKGQVSYGRLCKRLASITLPDPSLLPYQTLSLEELKRYIEEILNKLFDNAYKDEITTLNNTLILEPISNPFDAVLDETYEYDKLLKQKIHISNKLASVQVAVTAHEIVHALLSKYYGEEYNKHLNNIHYKELLSIIMEYIVCFELSKILKEEDLILKHKLTRLHANHLHAKEKDDAANLARLMPTPSYRLYEEYTQHTGYGVIISDLYATRLLDLYKDDPIKLISMVKGVIDGDTQIKELIKHYNLSFTDKPTTCGYYEKMEDALGKSKKYQKK